MESEVHHAYLVVNLERRAGAQGTARQQNDLVILSCSRARGGGTGWKDARGGVTGWSAGRVTVSHRGVANGEGGHRDIDEGESDGEQETIDEGLIGVPTATLEEVEGSELVRGVRWFLIEGPFNFVRFPGCPGGTRGRVRDTRHPDAPGGEARLCGEDGEGSREENSKSGREFHVGRFSVSCEV